MITIGLDEFGHFEIEKFVFIGGFIYCGTDYEEEKLRIEEYLKKECEKEGGSFPQDLHRNRFNSNAAIVNKIKKNISISVVDYLKNNGKYHIVCMLKSKRDRKLLEKLSNLVDDKIASNLYEHMICSTINNILFNNICLDDEKEVNLEIPTRISVIPIDDEEKIKEFEALGYKSNYKEKFYFNKKSYGFYVTDEKTFKTSISSVIMHKKNSNLTFKNINIKPIDYEVYNAEMPYMYLADFICNNISLSLDSKKGDFGINNLHCWAKQVTGNELFLWIYDDIDTIYNNVMDSYYKGDIYDVLDNLYEINNSFSDFSDYYNKHWFNHVKKKLINTYNKGYLDIFIMKINNLLKENNLVQDKAVFIFDSLWNGVKEIEEKIDKKQLYRLADIGIRVYNHVGDTVKTQEFYSICNKLKNWVDIEEYLSSVNKVAVIFADRFDFQKAYELSAYNAECFSILKKAKMDIAMLNNVEEEEAYMLPDLGRSLSSCGQYLAFMKETNAINEFEKAFQEFKGDKANTAITMSYLLHHAIDIKDIKLYEKYCVDYFGGYKDLEEQFAFITGNDSLISNKDYALYVFMKSLNYLYLDSLNESLIKKIRETDYKNKGFNTSGHPWELIYKNIGIILYKKGSNKFAKRFMENGYSCIKNPETTILAINYFTRIQEAFYEKDHKLLGKIIEEFKKWTEKDELIHIYFKECFDKNVENAYKKLEGKFTYAYI